MTAGTDPQSSCEDEGPTSCGHDGTCDGQGACAFYGPSTECAPQICAGNTRMLPWTCDGAGTCADNGTQSCGAYQCMGDACATDCHSDDSCASGQYCDIAAGVCVPTKGIGVLCPSGEDDECQSGHCVDGVCCDTACGGPCQACSAVKKGSGASGVCGSVAAGTDPDGECSDQGAASCGTNGVCDGAGACQKYPAGTVCKPASCAGTTLTQASACNGAGVCVAGGTASCSPFTCGTNACKTSCMTNAECFGGLSCINGLCVISEVACTSNSQCASGHCVDGVCCNTACAGLCQACSASKKGGGVDGVCGLIAAGLDPDDECPSSAPATCGFDGACNGSGACRLWASGTVCAAGSCAGGTQTASSTCSGTGVCLGGATSSCAPYACTATGCKTSCTADADCAAGHACASGACGP